MKSYELAYLISPEISEAEIKDIQQKINSFIQSKEGFLDSSIPLERIDLSYPIKKKTQAYLVSLNFRLKAEEIGNLEKEIKSQGQILRYLIAIKEKPKAVKALRKPPVKKPEKEKKAELKDIEQKLDEILG